MILRCGKPISGGGERRHPKRIKRPRVFSKTGRSCGSENATPKMVWRRDGILVIQRDDPRLSWPERELVAQLGDKLYGLAKGGQDG